MKEVILREIGAQDRDWLVDKHRAIYAQTDGFDDSFGDLVADVLDDFLLRHDPKDECGWIAESEGARLGSIFCVRLDECTAQLRLFLLLPEARGKGLGRRMLRHCMRFAQKRGYSGMRLWTHQSHEAACALYKAQGWQCIETKPTRSFGQDLIVESYIYAF
ncbi:N-acetyltransferase [Roseobacter denitrificans]|uniref:Acetyltransferase, putative n=1 Tax=Roseobacter denitrificans (strain ATCC 33942 / OCh 114) TaxID=375451 RepID=Q169B7_ROSDO|nr:GNAT family N-acetyltransferase [Roseobacter denitrificans]ABG31426.1 acetyltransferase, putative [Roseobacter denitrificans OCh 114]AVL54439.1 N-acetyltransferase [Roseobacter denitrificans]SFG01129.1 Acetyltransferase (GNAT) family protein [Roseobacter denitrificans OCh 114]